MRARRKWLWILLGCGAIAGLILAFRWNREPHYQGRSLSAWLNTISPKDGHYSAESQLAIRHIGTNGLPYLLKWIQLKPAQAQDQRPGPVRMRLLMLCSKLPRQLADPLIRRLAIDDANQPQYEAFAALSVLGPDARSAIPTLTRLIETPSPPEAQPSELMASWGSSMSALAVLNHMGNEGFAQILAIITNRAGLYRTDAIELLMARPETRYTFNQTIAPTLMSCLDDSNITVAFDAADILCAHQIEPELVIFPLIRALERDDQLERRKVLEYLHAAFARNFTMASLLQFLQDTNSSYSSYAAGALGQLAKRIPDLPDAILPAFTNSLRDPRLPVRRSTVSALDLLENAAEPAVPALLDEWNDPDYKMRLLATNAIFDMPTYAVLRDMNSLVGKEALSESEKISFFKAIHRYTPGPRLAPLLNHSDVRIREMATNAFRKLQGSNVVNQTSENAIHQP